jgi:hypothetical protein
MTTAVSTLSASTLASVSAFAFASVSAGSRCFWW